MVQLLVQHGAEVDVCDQRGGVTPLHDAVSFGSKEVVNALLEAGARAGGEVSTFLSYPITLRVEIQGGFFDWSALKMTKCQIPCKSLQKSSKCQNFLRVWQEVIFRADQ